MLSYAHSTYHISNIFLVHSVSMLIVVAEILQINISEEQWSENIVAQTLILRVFMQQIWTAKLEFFFILFG